MFEYLASLPSAISIGLIWAVMSIGVFITYKVLDVPDLTVDGSFATGGMVCAVIIANGGHFVLGLLAGFAAGCIAGLITGLLHTFFGIPPILAGILTQLSLYSINILVSQGVANVPISGLDYHLIFYSLNIYDVLWKIALIVVALALVLYVFFGTELGASIRATGNNPHMARAQGINVKVNLVIGLSLSNGIVALAGALLAQYQGFANISMGAGAIVIGLCAVVIGGAIFSKISPNFLVRILGVAVGSVIYFLVFQSVIFFVPITDLLKLFSAVVVIIFLGIPYLRRKDLARYAKYKKNKALKAVNKNNGGESK